MGIGVDYDGIGEAMGWGSRGGRGGETNAEGFVDGLRGAVAVARGAVLVRAAKQPPRELQRWSAGGLHCALRW
jgi:hypothetical protein